MKLYQILDSYNTMYLRLSALNKLSHGLWGPTTSVVMNWQRNKKEYKKLFHLRKED